MRILAHSSLWKAQVDPLLWKSLQALVLEGIEKPSTKALSSCSNTEVLWSRAGCASFLKKLMSAGDLPGSQTEFDAAEHRHAERGGKAATKRRRGSQSSDRPSYGMSEAQRARSRYAIKPLIDVRIYND